MAHDPADCRIAGPHDPHPVTHQGVTVQCPGRVAPGPDDPDDWWTE